MSELSKRINRFFKIATKTELNNIKEEIILSDQEQKVFEMFYIEKKDIDFIAYTTKYSKGKIESDLRNIRKKLNRLI